MSAEQVQEVGWDEQGGDGSSVYLRLKEKGQKVRVRFVGKPIKFEETVKTDDGKEKTSVRFAGIVIYRNLDTKENEVKGFKFGWQIYKALRALNEDDEWGEPTQYDVQITRTEEQGSYYTVTPKPKSPITEAERQLVLEANLNLESMYLGKGSEPQSSDDHGRAEDDPFADE